MGEQLVRFGLTEGRDGVLQVTRVPQDDGGDEQVEAGTAMLLVLVCSIAYLAQAMDEHSPRQAVACLPLVQFLPGRAAQVRLADPVQG